MPEIKQSMLEIKQSMLVQKLIFKKILTLQAEKLIEHCHSQAEAMLQNPEYHDLTKFEKWLTEYGKKLHPENLTMIRIKHSLCGFYGRFPGFTMNDLAINPKLMGRKVELITECLESINKVEPGISSVKGKWKKFVKSIFVIYRNLRIENCFSQSEISLQLISRKRILFCKSSLFLWVKMISCKKNTKKK